MIAWAQDAWGPFAEFAFLRRALFGSLLLSLSACPVGVFLMLRRMSLTGDAMAHAILPGVAAGFLLFGLRLVPMTLGGLIVGALVALGASMVSRLTRQHEDSALAAFHLIALATGVMLVSLRGSSVDLMRVLFGTVLGLSNEALTLIALISGLTLVLLALIWRALVAECLDPLFLRSVSRLGPAVHVVFSALVVLNLVGGFQSLGTLLAVGLMILPAAAARFWSDRILPLCVLATLTGMAASVCGLLISYYLALPSGPAIILVAGGFYLISLLIGPHGGVLHSHTVRRRAL